MSTFGKRVTELRKEKNLTQKALGEIVGVTKNTVSTWERDLRMPEFETLNALCSFFGVNTAYLLGEDVERKEDSGSPLDDETAALYALDDLAEESEPYVKKLMQLSHEARLMIHASIDAAYKYERSIGELYRKGKNVKLTVMKDEEI